MDGEGVRQQNMPRHAQSSRENRFSRRLKKVHEEHLAPTNPPRPWTFTEIAEGTGLSVNYISRAFLGMIEYPGQDKLRALATFFDVSVDYFTREKEEDADADLVVTPGMMEALRKPYVRRFLLRAGDLGDEEWKLLDDLSDYARSLFKRGSEQQDKGLS